MTVQRLWRDLVTGRLQLALIPLVPILLLPFIIIAFIVLLPVWVVALVLLLIVRLITWLIDMAIGHPKLKPPVDYAFNWVFTFGGLARKLDRRRT